MKFPLILILLAFSFGSSKPQNLSLKNQLSKSEVANSFFTLLDTTVSSIQDSISKFKQVTFGTIISEILLAPAAGVLFAIPAAGLSLAIIKPHGDMAGLAAIPFMYLWYVIGSSVGTFLIAKTRNPDVSFWGTLGFGLAGSGAAIGIFSMKNDRQLGTFELYSFLGLPVLSEIIYVNLIDSKEESQSFQHNQISQNNLSIKTHQDLYNCTLLYKVELFKINF